MKNISKFNEIYLNKGIHKYINQLIRTKIVGNNGDLTKRAEKRLSKIYPDLENNFNTFLYGCS